VIIKLVAASFVVISILTSCVTSPPKLDVQLADKTEAYFARCLPSDGAMQLEVNSRKNKVHFTSAGEWLGETADAYKLQMSDPLGQTLLQLEVGNNALGISGVVAKKLPVITVDDEGFMQVSGHRVGIKAVELPCLFNLSFPQEWREHLVSRKVKADRDIVRMRMEQREVTVSFPRREGQVCAQLKWWRMWGLISHEFSWCIDKKKNEATMHLPDDWHLRWQRETD
jgi:hypothetical protein